jgi:hypothetical protein
MSDRDAGENRYTLATWLHCAPAAACVRLDNVPTVVCI